jgi:hypothetical protein
MAAAFGGVSAWFLFGPSSEGEAVALEAPTPGPEAPPSGTDSSPPPEPGGDAPSEDTGETTGEGRVDSARQPAGGGPAPRSADGENGSGKAVASQDAPRKPCSPDDPFCSSVEGPAQKGPSSSDSGQSGQGLSPEQLQATVGQYRGSLTRSCRPLVTQGSAKVAATVTVGASGSVQSVSTSGGDEVPGLASCVQSRIRNWSFPVSGGPSTFNVSFNFL